MFRFGDPGGRIYASVGASSANLLALWTSVASSGWSVSAASGRHDGGSCLRLTDSTAVTCNLRKTLDAQPTWGIAFGYRFSSLGGVMHVAALEDGTSTQVDLRLNTDGTLTLTRNGTALATSANSLAINTWYHVELKATIHITAGNYEVRVNGTSTGWIPAQGGTAVTRATANNSANAFRLGGNASGLGVTGALYDYDDVIVYDAQTTDANGNADIHDFIGDCGLHWLLPTGAGTTTQFTPDSGSNYARVGEATPDTTSYVEDSTVGHVDTYAMADLPAGAATVKSVASVHYAEKTDVGSRGMKAELRSAGGNAAHATEIALGNSYAYYFSNWGRDPNNGTPADWTVSAVNALEAGQTVSS